LYVKAHLDVLLDADRQAIFPRGRLDQGNLASMHWDSQVSGTSIPFEVASGLESEWTRFLAGMNVVQQHTVEAHVLSEEVEEPHRYLEGAVKTTTVNAYERDPQARRACIANHGLSCSICGFNFEATYGDIGIGYIVVHHLRPLSEISQEHELDPVWDLRPVCPNCHAMIHSKRPAYTIEEIKARLR
jgi:5-methylcytosine-specific restriction protein A